jgi:flagellar biosynthesis protein FlhG
MDQAEQLRIIKANKQIRPTARVITVTSGKGGVGKSNMSINLAIQFRKMGKRVVILDADFGLANIEIMFGAVPKHNLCDLVYEGKSISDIITQGPMGVGFISGGSGIAGMSNLGKDALTLFFKYKPNNLFSGIYIQIVVLDSVFKHSPPVFQFLDC